MSEQLSIVYNDGSPETIKRAQDWIRDYADPSQTFVNVIMSEEAYRKMQDAQNHLRKHSEGMDS